MVDEGRGVDNLEDLVDNVLMPANAKAAKEAMRLGFDSTYTGFTIIASTPPPTTDHPLELYFQKPNKPAITSMRAFWTLIIRLRS